MSRKREESGQIMIFAAMIMVLLVGIAAFSINAAYAFNQHSIMQAQIDLDTKYAAVHNCTAPSWDNSSDFTFHSPPQDTTSPYYGNSNYCEGYYQRSPYSLFGGILKFPFHISVHAIALGDVQTVKVPVPVVLGLNNAPCSFWVQSASATLNLSGNSGINYPATVANGCLAKPTSLSGTPPTVGTFTDPFGPNGTVPSSSGLPYTVNCGSVGKGCPADDSNNWDLIKSKIGSSCLSMYKRDWLPNNPDNNTIYEFPRGPGNVYDGVFTGDSKVKTYYFLPWCNGADYDQGMYQFTTSVTSLSGPTDIYTEDSTIIFSPGAAFNNSGQVNLHLNGPTKSTDLFYDAAFGQGIVLYQAPSTTCPEATFNFNGTVSVGANGIIDLSCTFLQYSGNSITGFGDLAVWELEVTGSGTVNVTSPSSNDMEDIPRGAALVQ